DLDRAVAAVSDDRLRRLLAEALALDIGVSPAAPEPSGGVLRKEGDYWTFAFDGAVARVRDAKGLRDIAQLIARPGAAVHVTALATAPKVEADDAAGAVHAVERARKAVSWRIRHEIARIESIHPALSRHLRRSIRTGRFCCYAPEEPIVWEIGGLGPIPRHRRKMRSAMATTEQWRPEGRTK
ncbi:MAG: hypothetical protein ACREQ9_09665, partial [Candidatus Binatia bacterium]